MIFIILTSIIVILIIAHLLISLPNKNLEKQKENWKVHEVEVVNQIVETKKNLPSENEFLSFGKVIANEQKIRLVNERINNLEKVVAQLAMQKITSKNNSDFDDEKLEFRIKVLEQQIDELKNPVQKRNTFYGQENDPMEERIRSLVFNSNKK